MRQFVHTKSDFSKDSAATKPVADAVAQNPKTEE
jgi:hypothetical protein